MPTKVIYKEPTVDYSEVEAPRFNINGLTGRVDGYRRLKCDWKDKLELVRQLLGYMEVVGDTVYYTLPHRFPVKGLELCVARSASCDRYLGGVDKDEEQPSVLLQLRVASFKFAQIDVTYCNQTDGNQHQSEEGIWRRENIRGVAEMLTWPVSDPQGNPLFRYVSDETAIDGESITSYIMTMSEWSYTTKVAGNPPVELLDLNNRINSNAIRSPTYGRVFQPETLKFISPQFNVERDVNNKIMSEVTLSFHHQPEGWNKFPRKKLISGAYKIVFEEIQEIIPDYGHPPFRPFQTYDFSKWVI